jgi:hypothetical protein
MFIRIVTGIKDHFEDRVVEWIMAATTIFWGSKLTGPNDAWGNPEAWAGMLRWMSENAWGWNCVGIGVARLLALAINGTFAGTWYARFSPLVRGISALLGAVLWFLVFLSVNKVASAGSGIYQLPLVLELWCLVHAWRETGQVWTREHARS